MKDSPKKTGSHDDPLTDFGFHKVYTKEKTALIRKLFQRVSPFYDRMNDIMSLGMHRMWKASAVNLISASPGAKLLDLAGGTGDISNMFLKQVQGNATAVILDITPEMIHQGIKNNEKIPFANSITWICGDAAKIPFPDKSFDIVTIAFGIRNVLCIDNVLQEAYRVLKPHGGQFICLEFSHVSSPILKYIYDQYSMKIIPSIGAMCFKEHDGYQYLVESIRKFPDQEALLQKIISAGFKYARYSNLSSGIAALHMGWRVI